MANWRGVRPPAENSCTFVSAPDSGSIAKVMRGSDTPVAGPGTEAPPPPGLFGATGEESLRDEIIKNFPSG